MINVDIISDLHVEFWADRWKSDHRFSQSPTLICAGDIGEISRSQTVKAISWLCEQYQQVFYVTGNHDYYYSSIPIIDQQLDQLASKLPNLKILRAGKIEMLGEYKIVGDTLWVPSNPALLTHPINDLNLISNLQPAIHEHYQRLRKFLQETVDEKTIVVTHHLPLWQSVALQYRTDPTNCWFLGNCEDIIYDCMPAVWVHGHTHKIFDYQYKNTRIICNPLGYPFEHTHLPNANITYTLGEDTA